MIPRRFRDMQADSFAANSTSLARINTSGAGGAAAGAGSREQERPLVSLQRSRQQNAPAAIEATDHLRSSIRMERQQRGEQRDISATWVVHEFGGLSMNCLRTLFGPEQFWQQRVVAPGAPSSAAHRGRSTAVASQSGRAQLQGGGETYEQLLALDAQNVKKGINVQIQRHVVEERRIGPRDVGATTCVVCQEDFAAGEKVSVLPCGHCFHGTCITPWLLQDRTCPTCRQEVYHKAMP